MKKSIKNISVHQTSKVIALMYGFIVAIVLGVMFIVQLAMGLFEPTLVLTTLLLGIVAVFFYVLAFYIVFAIGLMFYNMVAKWVGGIEVTLDD